MPSCPLCDSLEIYVLYTETDIPVFQNKVYSDPLSATKIVKGDMSLSFCKKCGFIWNNSFNPSLLEYDQDYQNEQGHSSVFQSHLKNVSNIISKYVSEKSHIVEIGCGKATFLTMLGNLGYDVHGYDPAYEGVDPRIVKSYYSSDLAEGYQFKSADLLILRHVLEHIQNPLEFLKNIANANNYSGLLYIEVPDFDWILDNNAFYDVFYEHCNYFSLSVLQHLFPDSVCSGTFFGGQYCYIIIPLETLREHMFISMTCIDIPKLDFSSTISKWQTLVRESQSCVIWGAGAKGATFLRKVDPSAESIVTVIDINPVKQEKFIPQTAHPIKSLEILSKISVSDVIIMNDNYQHEISDAINNISDNISIHVLGL